MNSLLEAIRFLTITPIKTGHDDRYMPSSVSYFPVAGLLLGLLLAGLNQALGYLDLNELTISVSLVAALAVMTGGLHLDGLADTFDALMSGKPREEMLRIMRDPHIGTMGVLSLVIVLLLKTALIYSIAASVKVPAIILMCVLGRWAMSLSIFLFPYARQEGKASIFIDGKRSLYIVISTVFALAITIIAIGINGLTLFAAIALAAYVIGRAVTLRLGGITGDVLGATNELIEVAVLFGICILKGAH